MLYRGEFEGGCASIAQFVIDLPMRSTPAIAIASSAAG